jgi:anti-sigma factor RsiW
MICRELIAVLDEYLDGTLVPDVVIDLERHLAVCDPCRAYLATYRKTRELGARVGDVPMPEEMTTRLRALLVARLGNQRES